jgi:lactoylglutathione lyase
MGDGITGFQLELTCLRDHPAPYDLGENESHIAFEPEDFASARKLHKEMGCVCFENPQMGVYFIEDPDGYWLEIVPKR